MARKLKYNQVNIVKNNRPFLSIITINYNNADGLKKTLQSVASQTCPDYEHIIIDGGSTDGSVDVIKEFLKNDAYAPHVAYWHSKKDKGIYDAMNKGIPHATGVYCLFLNSGDWLAQNNALKNILEDDFGEDIVYFNTNYVYPSKNKIERKNPPKELSAVFLFCRGMLNHQSLIVKTDLQKKHPFNLDYKIVADRFFFLTALLVENCSTKYLNLTLCNFEAENGLSSKKVDEVNAESRKLIDVFFPKRVQESLALLEDYENGYKGLLKKARKFLLFLANHTVRMRKQPN